MNYPLISEYIEAIKSPEDNFDKLRHLRPVLDDGGNPVMSSGNFAVVFKMTDGQKDYALKCFTKDQQGREEAYRQIAEELENVSSPFLCPIRYLEKELFVDAKNCTETEFPVLLMDWVEGKTLDAFVSGNLSDAFVLESLSYNFCRLSQWLLTQPFAHGDLKPDNILVQKDGSLVLVDYDGMFVPAMKGGKACELGSPNYRHPLRTEELFDEHIDDFALASIALSLKAIALRPQLYGEFGSADRLLFSENDFHDLSTSKLMASLQPLMNNPDLLRLHALFLLAYTEQNLANVSFRLFGISKPVKPAVVEILSTEVIDEDLADAWEDEFGVKYSKDGKRLLKASLDRSVHEYYVKEGTEIICNGALQSQGNWHSLKKIVLPESVLAIGTVAFANNEDLVFVNIPKAVRQIQPNNPFGGCFKLKTIENQSNYLVEENNFYISRDRKIIFAYKYSCSASNVTIPNGVEIISANSFWRHETLCNIKIPNSVNTIGRQAFHGCKSLQSINIPNSVTSIGDSAFDLCESLQSINIPDSVTSIGDSAFSYCKSLQSINIPDSVMSIGKYAFSWCSSLQRINIPDSVTSIGDTDFSFCDSLQSINIPKNSRAKFEKLLPYDKDKLVEVDE